VPGPTTGADQRVTIWGAGAIGAMVGAWLAQAGVDVLLVDTNLAHVEAMKRSGLRITGMRGDHHVSVKVALPEEVEGPLGLVLLAVKCHHTERAVATIQPLLAGHGYVVSMQNGLNEELIAAELGSDRTVGCFVNFSADWQRPGMIEFGGEHPLYVGELDGTASPRVEALADLLSHFAPTFVTSNIWGYLWSKLCLGSLLFATALVDAPVFEVLRRPDTQSALYRLVQEALTVPLATGVRLEELHGFRPHDYLGSEPAETLERLARLYEGQTKVKTGVWRDLAVRHRQTEVRCQPGLLMAKGQALGIDLPLHRTLLSLVEDLEQGSRQMGWENLDVLASIARTTAPEA
jgi:2-dehydropantoate 2-reductase